MNLQRKCLENGLQTPFSFFFSLLKRNFFKKDVSRKKQTNKNTRKQRVQANQRAWGACCLPMAQPWPLFVSPQPFMSPRYAGGPRPPIRMGNQVLHSQDSAFPRDSCSLGRGMRASCPASAPWAWVASPPWSPSFLLVLEHQVSFNDDGLVSFWGFGLPRVETAVGNVLLSTRGAPSRAVPCRVLAARLDFPCNRRKLKWWR